MARSAPKRPQPEPSPEQPDVPSDRPGLPAKEAITGVEPFVSPQREEYTIIHTTEADAYDQPPMTNSSPRRRKG